MNKSCALLAILSLTAVDVAVARQTAVTYVFATRSAFAALKEDGSVVTWGRADEGGDSSAVAQHLGSGVTEIFAGPLTFAALKVDGSVITWGDPENGGDSSNVAALLNRK